MLSLALGALLCLATPGEGHWAGSWASIRAAAAGIRGVEAEFVQRKRVPLLREPLLSRGKLSFDASGNLRWEYVSPVRSLVELKNGRVRRYLWVGGSFRPDARQRADAMQVVLGEIQLWLAGRFQDSESFRAELQPGAQPRLILTPRRPALGQYIRRIELWPGAQKGSIARVIILEPEGAETVLEFDKCQMRYR